MSLIWWYIGSSQNTLVPRRSFVRLGVFVGNLGGHAQPWFEWQKCNTNISYLQILLWQHHALKLKVGHATLVQYFSWSTQNRRTCFCPRPNRNICPLPLSLWGRGCRKSRGKTRAMRWLGRWRGWAEGNAAGFKWEVSLLPNSESLRLWGEITDTEDLGSSAAGNVANGFFYAQMPGQGPRIWVIKEVGHYWLVTLLDSQYKNKITDFPSSSQK